MKEMMKKFLLFFCVCALNVGVAVAATSCEDESNDAIAPEFALCSVHAYNVGAVENPTTIADKQLMQEIVALKTTIITQQMYKQYEQMESMLKRFKTQLEKAVLTNNLKVASGSSDDESGGASYSSSDKYTVLAGTTNCLNQTADSVVSCLRSNLRVVSAAATSGSLSDARKQYAKDYETATSWQIVTSTGNADFVNSCGNMSKAKKQDLISCVDKFIIQINLYEKAESEKKQQRMSRY